MPERDVERALAVTWTKHALANVQRIAKHPEVLSFEERERVRAVEGLLESLVRRFEGHPT